MNTTMSANGRAGRKSLASQLDRLDGILDALSDGLNEAVATVVEDAVSKAVAVAVKEVLTNPELLRAIRALLPVTPGATPEPPRTTVPRPNLLRQALAQARATLVQVAAVTAARCFSVRSWLGAKVRLAVCQMLNRFARIRDGLSSAVPVLWHGRKVIVAALGAGLVVGLGCYQAGPIVSAAVSGVAGFAGALVAGVLRWLRRQPTTVAQPA